MNDGEFALVYSAVETKIINKTHGNGRYTACGFACPLNPIEEIQDPRSSTAQLPWSIDLCVELRSFFQFIAVLSLLIRRSVLRVVFHS
eukprot:TRINITY_DN5790_c0_g1_i1.p1 TRINITY_DN5790_c0_g1~~TRINITY_DN5790_c0_g1_i1.p1  ORF type:complete len:88 (+),score=6.84 TRINITY_DN5790_c0_g1_i1:237-500(+)